MNDPHTLASKVEALSALARRGVLPARELEAVFEALTGHPDAAETLQALLTVAGAADERVAAVLGRPGALVAFATLASQGDYPARMLVRHPHDLDYILDGHDQGYSPTHEMLTAQIEAELEREMRDGAGLREALYRALRWFKRRESLRIFLREVEGLASVRQTTAEIAALAEACLTVATRHGARLLGDATLADDFCVLGMGKLGGLELNFSSDIDLIYVCSDAAAADAERRRALDTLARELTEFIEAATVDGYVFRVDLRLRPEGTLGPLVQPVGTMVQYYLTWGRTWERSAMLKARPVAGNRAIGERLHAELEPFLYRKYLDFSVIDELRRMKQMVDANARLSALAGSPLDDARPLEPPAPRSNTPGPSGPARGGALSERLRVSLQASGLAGRRWSATKRAPVTEPAATGQPDPSRPEQAQPEVGVGVHGREPGWDVKLGQGGIREIEFFVQALQLVHCGMRPGLRVRNTLDALDRLLYAGLVSHDDHARLADAYDFYRRVEHRIQMAYDRQGHRLPSDEAGVRTLAARMGLSAARLREEVARHREGVGVMFARLFRDSEKTAAQPTVRETRPPEVFTVLAASPEQLDAGPIHEALRALGFERPRQVAGQLQMLRARPYGPFSLSPRGRQGELAAYLLEACAAAPDADQAFSFLSRLFTLVGDQPGFYRMLFENPHATRLLVHVFGSSQLLSNILLREPGVFERLVGVGTAAIVREPAELSSELARRLRDVVDPDRRLGRIRRFQQEETLRIALHEIAGVSSIEQTTRQLGLLAQIVLRAVAGEVLDAMGDRLPPSLHRQPGAGERADVLPMVILGMGKLGGCELGFGSDLDMIFVYRADVERGFTHEFFTRFAQRFVRALSTPSEAGRLYEVDMALRPSGNQGTLVVSVEAFEAYHRERADLWERQALVKARVLSGEGGLCDALDALIGRLVFARPLEDDAAARMRRMREQMLEAASLPGGAFDIKRSPGGLIDLEFLTQYLQLRYGQQEAGDGAGAGADAADAGAGTGAGADAAAAAAADAAVAEGPRGGARTLRPGIRSQNTLAALAALRACAQLGRDHPALDLEELAHDYRTLRRVEARLRVSDYSSSDLLPRDEGELRELARLLGYQGRDAHRQLRHELDVVRDKVRRAFEIVF